MRLFFIVVAALFLSGCVSTPVYRMDVPVPMPPANIMTRCEALPPPLVKPVTMGGLLQHDVQMVSLYVECASRDQAKADWIEAQIGRKSE